MNDDELVGNIMALLAHHLPERQPRRTKYLAFGLRLEQRPLTVLRVHGDEPEIALFLQVSLDEACISSSRLADRLDEQTFANTQLDADVVWT